MKKVYSAGLLVAFLIPASALAQSAIDGTWKVDLNKVQMPKKPDVYVLQNGMYQCKTCVPAISVKADGLDHKVSGNPYFDMIAISAPDDHTVKETDKKDGKIVATSTTTVAADGKTATFEFTDSSDTNAAPVTGKGTMTRAATGPKGSNAISGSWRTTSLQNFSDNVLTMTFKSDGDMLSMSNPTGQSYSAKMDGSDAPYKGDPGISSVSVKKMGKNTVQETDKRNGKTISVSRMTVTPDGKTMNVAVDNKLQGSKMSFVAEKQ